MQNNLSDHRGKEEKNKKEKKKEIMKLKSSSDH
jgi:hypothetical protein